VKKIIRNNPKTTIGTLTGIGALIVILLTIYEKTEAIISKAIPSSKENYNVERYMNDFETKPARKK